MSTTTQPSELAQRATRGLDDRERRVLEFIVDHVSAHGYCPTVRDVARVAQGSAQSVAELIRGLIRRELLAVTPGAKRSLHVTDAGIAALQHGAACRTCGQTLPCVTAADMDAAGAWLLTSRGRRVRPLAPRPEDMCFGDIADTLANKCHLAGMTKCFFSIAQHSVHVSEQAGQLAVARHLSHAEIQLARLLGLLHDVGEAYLCDIPTPIKPFVRIAHCTAHGSAVEEFEAAERRVRQAAFVALGVGRFRRVLDAGGPIAQLVHDADREVLAAEFRDLLHVDLSASEWSDLRKSAPAPNAARQMFVDRARMLELIDLEGE